MRCLRPVLLTLVLLAAALPASAAAAAPWSAPATLKGPAPVDYQAPALVAAGNGAVGWWQTGTQGKDLLSTFGGVLGFAPLAAEPGGTRQLDALDSPPVAYGADRLVAVRARPRSRGRSDVQVAFGRPSQERVGRFRTLETGARLFDPPVVAASARGDVAAAWVQGLPDGRAHLRLAIRRPGHGFARPATILGAAPDRLAPSDVTLAWGAGGDLVIAFQRARGVGLQRQEVAARVKRAGHGLGRVERLAASRGRSDIAARVGPDGRVVVAWGVQDGGEEANTPFIVGAAVRPAGPHAFRAARTLDPGAANAGSQGHVVLGLHPDGGAIVAWSSAQPRGADPIRYADLAAGASRFGPAQELGAQGGVGDLAIDGEGRTLLAWTTAYPGTVLAAVRESGATRFGAPELVSVPGEAVQGAVVAVAAVPGGGFGALWPSRPEVIGGTARMRTARRAG